jgi:photosystem II stability/assembly factor-like uncharacterized protein
MSTKVSKHVLPLYHRAPVHPHLALLPHLPGSQGGDLLALCVRAVIVALVCAIIFPGHPAGAATGRWAVQDSGTGSDIYQIACPTVSVCYAAASQGTITGTTNGGRTWTSLLSGATHGVDSIACPSARVCIAGSGQQFNILRSRDAGRTWDVVYQPADMSTDSYDGGGLTNYYYRGLYSATCVTARLCYLVGTVGHVYRSADGGTTWSVVAGKYTAAPNVPGTSRQSVLSDISCPTAGVCYTVGFICNCSPIDNELTAGAIAISTDGGVGWRSRTIVNILQGVSCLDARTCVAVGYSGTILRTSDGGRTWPSVPTPSGAGQANLVGVRCVGGHVCRAVGGNAGGKVGVVLRSTDGGRTWRSEPVPTTAALSVIACPSADICYVGGAHGVLLKGS